MHDFNQLLELQDFEKAALNSPDKVKPIVIIIVDRGLDENSRFLKTLVLSIDIYKIHNLDALFVLAHAHGQSTFNAVECRMAPLSLDLAGLILPHDDFDTYLDASGTTTDFELEKQYFKPAGKYLSKFDLIQLLTLIQW
ncbi:unnamed protein product [Rotaria sp. Silwood2]|nr:unnamed protein product [Rotaria sp. Silwood2]CAF4298148.1 unnamed protein product [Rotaria sp. Silwood2]